MENRRRYTQRIDLVFVLKIFGSSSCLLGFEIFSAFSFEIYWVGLVQNRRNSKKKKSLPSPIAWAHLVPVVIIFYKKIKKETELFLNKFKFDHFRRISIMRSNL